MKVVGAAGDDEIQDRSESGNDRREPEQRRQPDKNRQGEPPAPPPTARCASSVGGGDFFGRAAVAMAAFLGRMASAR